MDNKTKDKPKLISMESSDLLLSSRFSGLNNKFSGIKLHTFMLVSVDQESKHSL